MGARLLCKFQLPQFPPSRGCYIYSYINPPCIAHSGKHSSPRLSDPQCLHTTSPASHCEVLEAAAAPALQRDHELHLQFLQPQHSPPSRGHTALWLQHFGCATSRLSPWGCQQIQPRDRNRFLASLRFTSHGIKTQPCMPVRRAPLLPSTKEHGNAWLGMRRWLQPHPQGAGSGCTSRCASRQRTACTHTAAREDGEAAPCSPQLQLSYFRLRIFRVVLLKCGGAAPGWGP